MEIFFLGQIASAGIGIMETYWNFLIFDFVTRASCLYETLIAQNIQVQSLCFILQMFFSISP